MDDEQHRHKFISGLSLQIFAGRGLCCAWRQAQTGWPGCQGWSDAQKRSGEARVAINAKKYRTLGPAFFRPGIRSWSPDDNPSLSSIAAPIFSG